MVLADGRIVPADVVVVGIGAVPNIEWLRDGPLELAGGVVCDADGAHVDPECRCGRRLFGLARGVRGPAVPRRTLDRRAGAAGHRGRHAACRRHQGTPAKPPYFWSDQYGVPIQFAGIAGPHDEITFEVGSADEASFLAVYRRGGSTRSRCSA